MDFLLFHNIHNKYLTYPHYTQVNPHLSTFAIFNLYFYKMFIHKKTLLIQKSF